MPSMYTYFQLFNNSNGNVLISVGPLVFTIQRKYRYLLSSSILIPLSLSKLEKKREREIISDQHARNGISWVKIEVYVKVHADAST